MARKEDVSKVTVRQIFERGILSRNPVLVHAIGLCPLIAVAKSAATALAISIISAVILISCEVLAALVYKKLPKWLRIALYTITGVLIAAPIQLFTEHFLPSVAVGLGIYIPLLAVNSLIMQRCETFAVAVSVKKAFFDAAANSLGYALALMLCGIIREMLGSSKIFGVYFEFLPLADGFLMPFCGFIILGFIAAFINWMRSRFRIGEEFDKKPVDLANERLKRERAMRLEQQKAQVKAHADEVQEENSSAEDEAPREENTAAEKGESEGAGESDLQTEYEDKNEDESEEVNGDENNQ